MADPTGFEPAFSSVTGRRVWPLHHGSIFVPTHYIVSLQERKEFSWSRCGDLNPGPSLYESAALPLSYTGLYEKAFVR